MIDFQATGFPPTREDVVRLSDYKRRRQLLESDHATAFAEKSAKLPPHLLVKQYLVQDYPKLITTVFADLLFGEAPAFSLTGYQEDLDDLVQSNDLHCQLYEGETGASALGDAVFRLRIGPREDGAEPQVLIEEVQASSYFVQLDPDNCRVVRSRCLAWIHHTERQSYLRVEHHEPGKIYQRLHELTGAAMQVLTPTGPLPQAGVACWKVGPEIALSVLYGDAAPLAEEDTRVDVPLLFHVPNTRPGWRYFGCSDYTTGLESLFDEANARITSISDILDKHEKPKLVLPEGSLDKRKKVSVWDLEVLELPLSPGAVPPSYLTWDGQLTAAFNKLDLIGNRIFKFAEVSPAIFGDDQAGSIESGRAMEFRFMRTLSKVTRKRLYWTPALRRLLWTGLLLKAQWFGRPLPAGKPGDIEVTWRSGLPKDKVELVAMWGQRVANRTASRETAILAMDGDGRPAALVEMARIRGEESAAPVEAAPHEADPAPSA